MSFSSGSSSITHDELLQTVTEGQIINYYLGITEIPCVINSPLREDARPSFGIYSPDGNKVRFKDLATGDSGGLFDLLSLMWNLPFSEVLQKINKDLNKFKEQLVFENCNTSALSANGLIRRKEHSKIEVKVREWRKYDLDYWKAYGVTLDWLKFADVFPISHKIITKGNKSYTFGADKYAYAFIERKEGNLTIKIYQPYNKNGFKWCTSTDSSVISLWSKVPETGDKICICSSLKDALCLWSNIGIPSIAPQGEGYNISQTAIKELNRRYKKVYILFDSDKAGLIDGEKLSRLTGFTNVVLPKVEGAKDVSDIYLQLRNKQKFIDLISPIFINN